MGLGAEGFLRERRPSVKGRLRGRGVPILVITGFGFRGDAGGVFRQISVVWEGVVNKEGFEELEDEEEWEALVRDDKRSKDTLF